MTTRIPKEGIRKIVGTDHHDPFEVLGAHVESAGGKRYVVVRAFVPDAESLSVAGVAKGGAGKLIP